MMYPRLKLARNLLADDGFMFISIDDNEAANLARLCDEVFGSDELRGRRSCGRRTLTTPKRCDRSSRTHTSTLVVLRA